MYKKMGYVFLLLAMLFLGACGSREQTPPAEDGQAAGADFEKLKCTGSAALTYADQFCIEEYGDYRLITIAGADRFLIVPKDAKLPENLPKDLTILQQPLDQTYLVSTSVLDLIRELGALDNVRFSGTKEQDWYVDAAVSAMADGDMRYAGKYSAPDYELLLSENCNLAIENTMILHNPETKEKLEELGIPVLVERSSYETHPLGRLEWIKLYGCLYGKEAEAERFFEEAVASLSELEETESAGLSVAFFSVSSDGSIVVRKSKDYIAQMIRMAGGEYVFSDLGGEEDNALSTVRIQMEEFYAAAREADILVYNSTIEGELEGIGDLLEKNELFADFAAVKSGRVYCSGKNFFQETAGSCDFILDIYKILQDEKEGLRFLEPLD